MTREEAIKLIDDRMCFGRGKWSKHHMPERDAYWEAGEMAIEALEQPEQKWIPCTPDTMPSENDAYIVTCVGECTKWTDVAEYSKRHKGWRYGLRSDNIIAWMPLPEPWREENR